MTSVRASTAPDLRVVGDSDVDSGVDIAAAGGATLRRGRVLDLVTASRGRVVTVNAPAGAGKSTLAQHWAEADSRPHLTVHASSRLDEPAALVDALMEALGSVGPATGRAQPQATAVEPTFSTIVLPLLGALAASRTEPFVLVVDDVHLLTAPACHLALREVAESLPQGSQLLLLSRRPGPQWLSRLRASGEVLDLGAADLAFDVAEAAALFESFGVPLSPEEAALAVEQSEGWAIGLCLAARTADAGTRAGSRTFTAPSADGLDRYVADYLRSELLSRLAEGDRAFLEQSSVLDVLSPEACDAVLARHDSAAMLARLHEEVLLLLPVDSRRRTYRFHHLLEQTLREDHLRSDPAEVSAMHVRATAWFAGRGEWDTAVRHAKASRDLDLLGATVWQPIPGCIGSGRPDRLVAWLSDIDEADLLADRWLSLSMSWSCLQTGRRDEMERWMHVAERHAGRGWRSRSAEDEYAASLAVLVALAGRGSLQECVELCVGARQGLPPDSPFLAPACFLEGVARTLLNDGAAGLTALQDAERYARTLAVPLIEADSLAWQGLLQVLGGQPTQGARTISRGIELCRAHDLEQLATSGHTVTAQALALALLHDPAAAETLARARRLSVLMHEIAPWVDVLARLIQARAAVALGQAALTRQLLAEARTYMTPDLADSLAQNLMDDVEANLRLVSVDGVSASALTAAEMRVLQYLPSHLTFPQIGQHLFLTSNTVKTHALSIYRKLAVTSRGDAVRRAQSLGLVHSPPSG